MKRLIVVALTSLLVAAMLPASAHHIVVGDGATEKGAVDIAGVRTFGGTSPRWKITTHGEWGRKTIWDQGYFAVYIDTFAKKRHDYYALIWADQNNVRGTLFRDRQRRSDYEVGELAIRRGSRRGVSVTVPLALMKIGAERKFYNWYVQSTWSGRRCPYVCFDWAPNLGSEGVGYDEPFPI